MALDREKTFSNAERLMKQGKVALALDECRAVDEAILGFRWEGSMKFVLAQARHLSPMGAGFWQLGFRLKEVVRPGDYPELETLRI